MQSSSSRSSATSSTSFRRDDVPVPVVAVKVHVKVKVNADGARRELQRRAERGPVASDGASTGAASSGSEQMVPGPLQSENIPVSGGTSSGSDAASLGADAGPSADASPSAGDVGGPRPTFTNPLNESPGSDPWMIYYEGRYHLMATTWSNGFFKSPDGTEDWIAYHANSDADAGCYLARNTRIQPFSWNADGTPKFGAPLPLAASITVPSGE